MAESQPESDAPYLAALERIAAGDSTRAACLANGVKASALVMRVVRGQDPAFSEQYARAREAQAIVDAERIDEAAAELEAGARSGAITSEQVNAWRASIDARKWAAARKHPKVYGDRTEHNVSVVALTTTLTLDAALASGLRALGAQHARHLTATLLPAEAGSTEADPPTGGE
jgi:hypothetical protein